MTDTAPTALRCILPPPAGAEAILTDGALAFLAALHHHFEPRRQALLTARRQRQATIDAGALPDFLRETADIRAADWQVAPIPPDLRDRRVEITGPVDRKMVINALNSGACTFMADFEDSNAPTFDNLVRGQQNLADAVRRRIDFQADNGKQYRLVERPAVLLVRPRGWHLPELHVRVAAGADVGAPMSGSLFDFGLFFFHNAREQLARGATPAYYLPKLEHHEEARLWNDVFVFAQNALDVPQGSVRATVLIETLPAAFQMDEILWQLRDHSAGLNCGRWDYIFSTIKTCRANADRVLPDRAAVTMTQPCMAAYTRLVVRTCHRRGVHAMGGMAAQIPIKDDPVAHAAAMAKVEADKRREASGGHDGTWVAHPGLVAVARAIFDAAMPGPHQIAALPEGDDPIGGAAEASLRAALLAVPTGPRTEGGVRECLRIGVQYLAAWLSGNGCVPIDHLMEDAATAEISRAQLWQWLRHGARLDDGRRVDAALLAETMQDEMGRLRQRVGDAGWQAGNFEAAVALFRDMTLAEELADFLTLAAYPRLVATAAASPAPQR